MSTIKVNKIENTATADGGISIDSSGRVGVDATPEAWSGFSALEVNEASIVSSGSGDAFFTANAYYDGAWKYKDAGVARNIYMNADGIVFRTAASGSADGSISWTEVGRWREGGGLCFNGDTAAANGLDDYEEGTFTPTAGSPAISGTSPTYTGFYTKIGNIVTCRVVVSSTGNNLNVTSYAVVGGLPFTSAASGGVGTGTVVTEDIDEFDRQGFINGANSDTVIYVSNCGSTSGTNTLNMTLVYTAA